MNILHITDFHYNGDRRIMDKIIPTIIKVVKNSGKQIDFIFFTGDLVFNGGVTRHFDEAKAALFDKLCTSLEIRKENVIFCPGNHDIDREQIRYAHDNFIKEKIKSNHDVDLLYKGKAGDKFISGDLLRPLSNYDVFLRSYHPINDSNKIEKLHSIHYRVYKGQKLAFICLYTPWLCNLDKSGEGNDYSNLLFPSEVFSEIETSLDKDVSKKIVLMHHPISFLKDFNAYEIENLLYENYDMLFVGHVHKMSNVTRHTGNNGIYEHTSKASLSKKDTLGCTFIENDDIESNIFRVSEITYIKDSNECHWGQTVIVTIPIGSEKEDLNKIRRKLYEKVAIEKENADNLLLLKQQDGGRDFLSSYNPPLIRNSKENTSNQSVGTMIPLSDIYTTKNHLVILGKDKCGKSSLLRRIQLEYLMSYTAYNRVPLFLDAKEEESKVDDNYSIAIMLRNYVGINKKLTDDLLASNQLVLLVDNYRPGTAVSNYLERFCDEYSNTLIIAVGEETITTNYEIGNLKFGSQYSITLLYFNDLRKKEIIQYTELQLSGEANKGQIQEKILKLCKQMELPYNYWTISLFLLIHHKASDAYSKNLYYVLDVCVDEIFDKKKILIEKWQVTYNQLKAICASLASYLFEYHEQDIYSATKDEILHFLSDECTKNRRITIKPEEIFNFFVSCGLLKAFPNGYYVFRLNGFFEYFLAYQMTQKEDFKQEILSNDRKYLAFKNQLEIYSGLRSNDSSFLKFVFEKTTMKCQPLFCNYSDDKDAELINKIEIPEQLELESKQIATKALTSVQRAEAEDAMDQGAVLNSEVHLIQDIDPTQKSIDVIGRYLSILSRVFKNIDQADADVVNTDSVFKTIINYYCDFSFFIIEELSERTKACLAQSSFLDIDEEETFKLLKLMSNFSPLIAQMEVYDGIGHFSMERMVLDEIEILKRDASHNQYKLFILYFLLFDLNLNGREQLMNDALSLITIPLLRYMMKLKFNYYMAFRTEGDVKLQAIISSKIRQVQKLLDNKMDVSSIESGISGMKKDALVNKQMNN